MNRNRWATIARVAAVTSVLAVLAGLIDVSLRSNDGRASGPARRTTSTLVRVALTAALGSREVVGGSRTVPVPVTTGSPPHR